MMSPILAIQSLKMTAIWEQLETQVLSTLLYLSSYLLYLDLFNSAAPGHYGSNSNANLNDVTVMTRDQSSINYPRQPVIQKYNKDQMHGNGGGGFQQ
jgi:hypothetical protein